MIEHFTSSALFDEITRAKTVRREFRFNVLLPAWRFTSDKALSEKLRECRADITVQGVTDVIFERHDGTLVLADYKTDTLNSYEVSHPDAAKEMLRSRHRSQLIYYKAACEKIFERHVDEVVVFSLALGDTVDIY